MQNFLDSAEYAMWKQRCKNHRRIAAENPCHYKAMVACIDYEFDCGPAWNFRLVLETFLRPPIWHATISHVKKIEDEIVYDKLTGLPIFETAREGMVFVKDWTTEELDVARSLLADVMGPLLIDEDQPALEVQEIFALHHILNANDVAQRIARKRREDSNAA